MMHRSCGKATLSAVTSHPGHEETFEPATLGSTPSSADALEEPTYAAGTEPDPPPGGTKRIVSAWPMWLLGLVIMIDLADQSIVRGVSPQLQAEFHVGEAAIGLLQSAFILVNGLITVPAGYLADRWHRSRTIGHTIIGWSAITALGAAMPNFASLVALRASLGFGQAITEPSAASLIADYYPAEQRGRAFSVQQCLTFVGLGLGVGIGGAVGPRWGWRWAFVIVAMPGFLIAAFAYRLREPKRGLSDRIHLGLDEDGHEDADVTGESLFEDGFGPFVKDMLVGLRKDLKTIWGIKTMRFAVVGVSTLLFTVNAIGAWLFRFYMQLGLTQGQATGAAAALLLGGIPGVLVGGRVADKYTDRIRGARMAIPAYAILVGNLFFMASFLLPVHHRAGEAVNGAGVAAVFALELLGLFTFTMAIPALRAGLSDAVPANLRGAGFGAFNLVGVVFGAAAAPFLLPLIADLFEKNFRTAFLVVSPPVFFGAFILLKARDHLDEDAAKIFQAILTAMQEQQERDAAKAEARAAVSAGASAGGGAGAGAAPEDAGP